MKGKFCSAGLSNLPSPSGSSESLCESLFRNNHIVMLLVDPETGEIIDANPAASDFYGYSREQFCSLKISNINALPGELVAEKMHQALTETCNKFEFPHRLADGTIRDVEVFSGPVTFKGTNLLYSIIHDITERKRTEQSLREAHQKYTDLVNNLTVGVYRATPGAEGAFLEVNPAAVAIFEAASREDLLSRRIVDLYSEPEKRGQLSDKLLRDGFLHSEEIEFRTLKGKRFWASIDAVLKRDGDGRDYFDGTITDITERKRAEEKLREMSLTDELTGLLNRRGFLTLAAQQFKIANRLNRTMTLIYADLDGMKWINDNLGHREGDRALIDTALILKSSFRASDLVARLGGDEFVGLALETSQSDGAEIIDRLQRHLDSHNKGKNRSFELSVSFGSASYDPDSPCILEDLLERADNLMYEQKQEKKRRERQRTADIPAPCAAGETGGAYGA